MSHPDELNAQLLIHAYRHGIFPWYSEGEPVSWWCPDPRMVLIPKQFKVSRSLKKKISQVIDDPSYEIRVDFNFINVIESCAQMIRPGQNGTWITSAIKQSYSELHQLGNAHSIETWHDGKLVGGLYAVNLGKMVYGESMFAKEDDASKLALAALCGWCNLVGIELIDCQQETRHLTSLGGHPIPRDKFLQYVHEFINLPTPEWKFGKNALKYWL